MRTKENLFSLPMKVRDYECDLQGVVNNANYQHYMEHTRHEFLESLGSNFGELHNEGIDAFVRKVTITYKSPLRSGDQFESSLWCEFKGAKLIFHQRISKSDGTVCVEGDVEAVVVKDGVLTRGEYFQELLKDLLI